MPNLVKPNERTEIRQKNLTHRVPPFKVTGTDTGRSATYDLLVIHSNYDPISYRFQDKRRFRSKILKKSHFPLREIPLEFCTGDSAQKVSRPYQKVESV